MKFLLTLIALGTFYACGLEEESAQHKFAIRKKAATSPPVYYHAKYRFTHADYESVEVAVKVEVQANKAKQLWAKDLSVSDSTLEEATLTSNTTTPANFRGTSGGDLGGVYTGVLEKNTLGTINGCCSEMTFTPTADTTVTFTGAKLSVLTAAEWQQLVDGTVSIPTPSVTVAELGTQKIGTVFSITGAENVQHLEAHNSEGKVEDALARWQTEAGADIFAVEGTDNLFLTAAAVTGKVTELIGYNSSGAKILKANVTVAARDDNILLTASRFALGNYTWVAFSTNPNPDPDDPSYIKNEASNSYLSFDADMEVHANHTGAVLYSGSDARGVWVGMEQFECVVGQTVMAKILDTVYAGNCLAEGS